VEFLAGFLAVLGIAATTTAATLLLVPLMPLPPTGIRIASARLGCTFPIARGKHDLKLDQFVPLRIGALPFGNRKQRLHALARRHRLLFAHI